MVRWKARGQLKVDFTLSTAASFGRDRRRVPSGWLAGWRQTLFLRLLGEARRFSFVGVSEDQPNARTVGYECLARWQAAEALGPKARFNL